jgi:Transposase C of IS166 homeodomain
MQNEQRKSRLVWPSRERFGASSEKLRGAIDHLELLLGDLEGQIAETAPVEPEQSPPSA